MTDDDWFDRALGDDDEAGDDVEDGGDAEAPADGASGAEDSPFRADQDDGGGQFGEVFGSALEEEGDEDSPFGGSDDDGSSSGWDDAFGDAANGAASGDGDAFGGDDAGQFGMSALGGGEDADFSDEAVDSDIPRIDLGIEGLDEMIRGGVPDSSLMAVIGSAGTGKTTFGLQFLQGGLSNGERAIYITLEESHDRIVRSAEEKGWPYREHVEEGRLAVVDMDPIEMANSLSSIRSELPRLIDRFGATRLVLDSVSLLEMMYQDRATRRNEIYTFARTLKESGVTILLTSEADEDNPYASRHGIVEYLTDAVYILQYVRPSEFQETRLAVEIQKIRDAHHSREMKPYEITNEGLSVYRQANIF